MGTVVMFPPAYHRRPRRRIDWVCAIVWLLLMPLSAAFGWYGLWRSLTLAFAALWCWL